MNIKPLEHLLALADTGSVDAACKAVNMSTVGAYHLRRQPEAQAEAERIQDKHGSRKGMPGRTRRTADGHEAPARPRASRAATRPSDTPQLSLDLNPEP